MVRFTHISIPALLGIALTVTTAVSAETEPCNCSRDTQNSAARIDPAVTQTVADSGRAKVLVFLKDDDAHAKKTSLALRRLQVKNNRTALLSGLALARNTGRHTADFDFMVEDIYAYSNSVSGWVTARGLKRLARHPLVQDIIIDPAMVPELMESIPQLGADAVWSRPAPAAATGKGSVVFILDTGVDYTHPAFGGCTRAQVAAGTCPRVLQGYDVHDGDDDPMDYYGHGTHVAGIVASAVPGVKGVAPGAVIVPVKVCSDGGTCSASKMIAGLEWCLDWYRAHGSDFTTAVVTTSISIPYAFTYPMNPGWFDALLAQMQDAGMSLVVPSGNQGSATGISYPACSPYTFSVGSVNTADEVSTFGNRDPRLDVWAPGVAIYAPLPDNTYGIKSGTSASAPHAAGAVALLGELAARTSGTPWTPAALYGLLSATGAPVTDPVSGLTRPRIDVLAAADSLMPVSAPVSRVRVTVPPVGEAIEEATFSVDVVVDSAAGDYVISLAGAPEWLRLVGDELVGTPDDGDTDATFSIIVNDGTTADTTEMTVTVAPVNDRPDIISAPADEAMENTPYRYAVSVDDPDDSNNGEELLWSLISAPEGMTINDKGVISWTPPEGVYSSGLVTVMVKDGGEDWSWGDLQSFIIGVEPDNGAPVFLSAAADTAECGTPYTYVASVYDAEEVPTVRFADLPAWLDTCGQAIAGIPPYAGHAQFTVICSDGTNERRMTVALAIRTSYGIIPSHTLIAFSGSADSTGNGLSWAFTGTGDAPECHVMRSYAASGPYAQVTRSTLCPCNTDNGTNLFGFRDTTAAAVKTYYKVKYIENGMNVYSDAIALAPYTPPVQDPATDPGTDPQDDPGTDPGTDPVSVIAGSGSMHADGFTLTTAGPGRTVRCRITAPAQWHAELYDITGRTAGSLSARSGNGNAVLTATAAPGRYVLTVRTATDVRTLPVLIVK